MTLPRPLYCQHRLAYGGHCFNVPRVYSGSTPAAAKWRCARHEPKQLWKRAQARAVVLAEWGALYRAGIVPQAPPSSPYTPKEGAQ